MFENFNSPLASRKTYHNRLIKTGLFAFTIFFSALSTGIMGYHFIAGFDWVNSFLNASMILGGMGEISELNNNPAKIFAGCYALFSGVTFLSSMAIFLSPIVHRLIHRLHIDVKSKN